MDRLLKNGKHDHRQDTSISPFHKKIKKILPGLLKVLTRPHLDSCVQKGVGKDAEKYNTGIRKGHAIK